MALSEQDIKTLQDISILEGKCMESTRCKICPFRAMCLPEFLNPIPPTPQQREKMAVGVLTHHALIDCEISIAEIEEDYKWDKK
jgi:hypothetical protein